MNILFLTNLIPYPLDNGGKIKTFNMLKMLSSMNNIDLFSFYEEEKDKENIKPLEDLCNNIAVVKKPLTTSKNMSYMKKMAIKTIFTPLPMVAYKFKDEEMYTLLEESIKKNKYDLVYIDHLQLAVYESLFQKYNLTFYLDQHNCESQIIKRQVDKEQNFAKKVFLSYEYFKLKKFEETMLKKAEKVVVLSQEDKEVMTKNVNVNMDKFVVIPIPVESNYKKDIKCNIKEEIKLIFLGTLSWYPNSQGLEWFLDKVIPLLEEKGVKYSFYIVGKDPGKEIISKCANNSKIVVTGYVDDINEYIEKCDVMVVPIFIGSGMRVKILEALAKAIPVISTEVGAEGIEVKNEESILISNNEQEFCENILKLKNEQLYKLLQQNGLRLFQEKYSYQAIENLIREKLFKDK